MAGFRTADCREAAGFNNKIDETKDYYPDSGAVNIAVDGRLFPGADPAAMPGLRHGKQPRPENRQAENDRSRA